MPFKSRGKADASPPSVQGIDGMASALVFDDDYLQQLVFQKDEILKNGCDIFLKTPDFVAALRDVFGKSKPGNIPKNSKIHAAMSEALFDSPAFRPMCN